MAACAFVLVPNTPEKRGTTCGKRVGWTMIRDDDDNLVRKYKPFCDEHQAWVDAHPDEEDEE